MLHSPPISETTEALVTGRQMLGILGLVGILAVVVLGMTAARPKGFFVGAGLFAVGLCAMIQMARDSDTPWHSYGGWQVQRLASALILGGLGLAYWCWYWR
jgi:hypothetical protein